MKITLLAILIVNHKTGSATLACLELLQRFAPGDAVIHVLDNGSSAQDTQLLSRFAETSPQMRLALSEINLGFAAGMNRLLELALTDTRVDQVLLLNNDTLPTPHFVAAMQAKLDPATRTEMIAARMPHRDGNSIDSLGITLYRSTLASNRKREEETLLGPTGGCALFTRRLLEDVRKSHGEWFDESFFCYAEDTDLVIRARWLGYCPAYAADAVVLHEGSLSSGGPDNDFVLYHGIRNSLWWLVKDAPGGWLLRSLPWFVLLHGGIVLRHLRRGRVRVLWRLYRDAIRGIPAMLKKRKIIGASRRVPAREFARWVEPHFYERDYVRRAWRELWHPATPKASG